MQVVNILFIVGVILFCIINFTKNTDKIQQAYKEYTISQDSGWAMSFQEFTDQIPLKCSIWYINFCCSAILNSNYCLFYGWD